MMEKQFTRRLFFKMGLVLTGLVTLLIKLSVKSKEPLGFAPGTVKFLGATRVLNGHWDVERRRWTVDTYNLSFKVLPT